MNPQPGLKLSVFGPFAIAAMVAGMARAQDAWPPPPAELQPEVRQLVYEGWDGHSLERARQTLLNENESAATRRAVLARALAEATRSTALSQLQLLADALTVSRATTAAAELRADALTAWGALAARLRGAGQLPGDAFDAGKPVVLGTAGDQTAALELRGAALRVIRILKLEAGVPIARQLLAEPDTLRSPNLARGACLVLATLKPADAAGLIGRVLEQSSDSATFATAAYCLSRLPSAETLQALLAQRARFRDTGAVGFALVEFEPVIVEILADPESPFVPAAIEATEFLYRAEQHARYLPLLQELAREGPIAARRLAVERLRAAAATRSFADEQVELRQLLPLIADQPELAAEAAAIRQRLAARLLPGVTSTEPTPRLRPAVDSTR